MKISENKLVGRAKPIAHKVVGVLARSGLLEVLLVSSLVLSRYYANIDFSYPSEVVAPILLLGGLGFIAFYIFRIFLGVLGAHIAGLLVAYSLYGFQYVSPRFMLIARGLLPHGLETTFTVSLVVVGLMMLVAGLLGWGGAWFLHRKWFRAFQPSKILVFFVLFVFASAFIKVGLKLIEIRQELAYEHKTSMPAKTKDATSKPDIYYIVTDRYANSPTLKSQYQYDNSAFTDFLRDQQFVVRDDAYANYPFTMSSISSTLSMDYHAGLGAMFGGDQYQAAFPYRAILNDPPVAQILKREGYSYNQVSSWWDFTRVGINADTRPTESFRLTVFGKHFLQSDLARDIINKSVLSPWLKKGLHVNGWPVLTYDQDDNPYQNFEKQMNALKSISASKHSQPQFTFAHILSPHDPYIFNKDGSTPSYDGGRNDNGADETVKYTNQLTYLNTRLEDTIGAIRRQSPGAVIILQADEGPYPKDFRHELTPNSYYNPITLPTPKMQQKFGILAGYYLPGVAAEDVSKNITTSVNPFRFVLSHYLSYDLPMLPECNFATGTKYRVYDYTLVTKQLTGRDPAAQCESYK
jgi:hypothetical protein